MSTKNLFDKGKSYKILPAVDPNTLGLDAESSRNIEAKSLEKNRFVPNVDFSSASNFVRYGSAKKYYTTAFDRITNEYPYDGSRAEKQEFFNSSSYLDLHIFDNEYPTTTGYVTISSDQWGSSTIIGTSAGTADAWGVTNDLEYIHIIGGPHTASGGMLGKTIHSKFSGSNIYDANVYDTEGALSLGKQGTRESNLKFDLSNGVTTEFWLNKGTWLGSALSDKEVIFDLWNGEASSSAGYGRLLIYLTGSSDGQDPIRAHLASGSSVWDISYGGSTVLTSSLTSNWKHVALTFASSSTQLESNFYYGGNLQESKTNTSLASFGEITGSLSAYIGGLRTTPSGNVYTGVSTVIGAGKLSASLDEFRYWKVTRTHEEVAKNYFRHVDGGANTDISNTELGVYYKFNEGITTDTATDATILDYSGRVSNGNWVGYPGSTARNTGSAIVSSSAAPFEVEDPIVYASHSSVSGRRTTLINSGSAYDYQNNSSIYYSLPTWVIEEDDGGGEVLNLTQIMASYFDTLHSQIAEVPKLKNITYTSSSYKPYSFSNRALESVGLFAPEIFVDASILEQMKQQSETEFYEKDLVEVKNLIYQNIYNNLVYIYKSKGTEKSFRNLIRCYGVDDELIKINLYGNNLVYKIRDNFRSSVTKKKYIDFNHPERFGGTVTHQTSSANTNTLDVTYVTGAFGTQNYLSRTAEIEVIFPKKFKENDDNFFATDFLSSSIFGQHAPKTSADLQDFVWNTTTYDKGFQLYAVRPVVGSDDAYFLLTNRGGNYTLTSSIYQNVYNDSKWNLAVKTYTSKKDQLDLITGSAGYDVIIELYGCNLELGVVKNEFSASTSFATSATVDRHLISPRRYYVGAHRTNFTGSLLESSDLKISSLRHWEAFLSNQEIVAHAKDSQNYGVLRPGESNHLYPTTINNVNIPKIETLALHWNFDDVTGSDSNGEFLVNDFSSGSIGKRTRYPGTFGEIVGNQYTGRGFSFPVSSATPVSVEYVQDARQIPPEVVTSYDMVNIVGFDDESFIRGSRTINHFFAVEKSMYQNISEEMLNMFGTIVGFNNLIGEPVNRYRQEYKDLSKLRNLFYENVENVPDLDKYVEFYRWIDSSLSIILRQLIPASANTSEDVRTVIESHVLERNKYHNKLPSLEVKYKETIGGIEAAASLPMAMGYTAEYSEGGDPITSGLAGWRYAHAPLPSSPLNQADNVIWWDIAEQSRTELSQTTPGSNKTRSGIIRSKRETRRRSKAKPYRFVADVDLEDDVTTRRTGRTSLYGGVNAPHNKKTNAYKDVAGFGTTNGFVFDNIKNIVNVNDVVHPMHKKYQAFEETNNDLKGEVYAPFRILSGSATGYNSSFSNFQVVNLHHDTYLRGGESLLQSPFTEKFVGGMASRHLAMNTGSDDITNRAESWKLTTTSTSLTFAHPDTANPRDTFSRNVKAKRPINIENLKITGSTALGNYANIREVVLVAGREGNNSQFVRNEGVPISHVTSTEVDSIVDHTITEFSSSKHIISDRFSAPGGFETSRGSLDAETGQYSVYNALPYRNLLARNPLRTMLSASTSQFGFRPGVTATAADYSGVANFHKVNRNTLNRIKYNNAYTGDLGTVATASIKNNAFVSTAIPQSDLQYSWVTSSYESTETGGTRISGRTMLGHAPRNFEVSASTGYVNAITFVSESHVAGNMAKDFVGLNTLIVEPVSSSEQTLGYPLTNGIGSYTTTDYGSVADADGLSALLSHRGDTFGFNTWKQIRTGDHPVARDIRENHIVSVEIGDRQGFTSEGRVLPVQRYGDFTRYRESPIITKYKPLSQKLFRRTPDGTLFDPRIIGSTYGNNISYFSNLNLNTLYAHEPEIQIYNRVRGIYTEETVTETNRFGGLIYGETVYPAEKNVFDNRIRERKGYTINYWNSVRSTRTDNKADKVSFGGRSLYSIWALDAPASFSSMAIPNATNETTDPPGELQNKKTQVHNGTKSAITASALYSLPHMLATTASFAAPSGMVIPETASAASTGANVFGYANVGAGAALWESGKLAGFVTPITANFITGAAERQVPAYDNYADYAYELRLQAKDYSIIPEFRISDHMDYYIKHKSGNFLATNTGSFDIFGATSSADYPTDSGQDQFYNVYTNSDFLKYFEVIKSDHLGLANEHSITLKCKGLMKFLPYNGFYPAERTLQMAKQFSASYASQVNYTGADSTYENAKIRPFLEPMFAPGITYNSIKSGIGVPYPVLTASYDVQRLGDYYAISSSNNGSTFRMIDFEAVMNPEKYLTNVPLVDMQPHPSASLNLTASWNGHGDPLYSMMASNFYGEVPEFFLPQGNMTTIVSKPESDGGFGNAYKDAVYGMRIKMYRSLNNARTFPTGYPIPQDNPLDSDLQEDFTMYSRPTGFFHAVSGRNTMTNAQFEDTTYGNRVLDSYNGYNWVATPPYYHGEAWVDILFTAAATKKYKLAEIMGGVVSTYELRFDNDTAAIGNDAGYYHNTVIRDNILNLADCLILDGTAKVKSVTYAPGGEPIVILDDPDAGHNSLVIQPKWETPHFNFNDNPALARPLTSGLLTIPTNGSESVPRGMWHQYGIPHGQVDGIYLEVTDIPEDWLRNHPMVDADNYNNGDVDSLADLLGIDPGKRRLGETRPAKIVSEAVVAIPYTEDGSQKKFFSIAESTYALAMSASPDKSSSIYQMIQKLKNYILPPKMDFITNPEISPFAMYVFEFEHTFDKDDLNYIWQNLPPKSITKVKEKEATISHKLLSDELLGVDGLPTKLRWMVFKIKRKAIKNYYSKTASRSGGGLEDDKYKFEFEIAGRKTELDYSYNWPYDFFSLVEMVKIDAEIEFRKEEL